MARAKSDAVVRRMNGRPTSARKCGSRPIVQHTRVPPPTGSSSNDSTCAVAKGTEAAVTVHAQRDGSSHAIIRSTQCVPPTFASRMVPTPCGGGVEYQAARTPGNPAWPSGGVGQRSEHGVRLASQGRLDHLHHRRAIDEPEILVPHLEPHLHHQQLNGAQMAGHYGT
jgi:hypothetical protein